MKKLSLLLIAFLCPFIISAQEVFQTNFQTETEFQQWLVVDNNADENTWQRIVAEYPDALTRIGPAEPLQLILNPGQVLKKDEGHPYLFLIQAMLTALAEAYGSISAPPMTGILDLATADAISSFQQLSLLPDTGEVDKITWKHLALQYPLAVNLNYSQNRSAR